MTHSISTHMHINTFVSVHIYVTTSTGGLMGKMRILKVQQPSFSHITNTGKHIHQRRKMTKTYTIHTVAYEVTCMQGGMYYVLNIYSSVSTLVVPARHVYAFNARKLAGICKRSALCKTHIARRKINTHMCVRQNTRA